MDRALLKEVERILESEGVSTETKNLINKLANENIKLNKSGKGNDINEDVIPDIESLKYRAAINDTEYTETNELETIRSKIQDYLRENHHEKFLNITNERQAREKIKDEIRNYCVEHAVLVKGLDRDATIDTLQKEILDYAVLTDLIHDYHRPEDKKIEEVRTYDWNDIRYVIKGQEYRTKLKFESPEQCFAIAQKICRNNQAPMIKRDRPFVRVRMGNNIRVSMMCHSVARRSNNTGRPVVHMAIRKQPSKPFDKKFLIGSGTVDEYGYELVLSIIKNLISVAFYGGTNSGKTGTMNAFIHQISNSTRTITAAEVDEMDARKVDPVTERGINSVLMWEIDPEHGMTYRMVVNAGLTFTPESFVLQETKGEESVDVIDAAITGHQIVTSNHAKDKKSFALRWLGMYKQSGSNLSDDIILSYVAEAFPIVIRMKLYKDGKRRIADIVEIEGYDRGKGEFIQRTLYEFKVIDSWEEKVYDEYLKEKVVKLAIKGRHIPVDFISDKLKDTLIENGMPKDKLNILEKMFNDAKKENKLGD